MTLTLFSHRRVRFGEHPSLSRIYQTLLQVVHFSRANDEIIGNKTLIGEIGTSEVKVVPCHNLGELHFESQIFESAWKWTVQKPKMWYVSTAESQRVDDTKSYFLKTMGICSKLQVYQYTIHLFYSWSRFSLKLHHWMAINTLLTSGIKRHIKGINIRIIPPDLLDDQTDREMIAFYKFEKTFYWQ